MRVDIQQSKLSIYIRIYPFGDDAPQAYIGVYKSAVIGNPAPGYAEVRPAAIGAGSLDNAAPDVVRQFTRGLLIAATIGQALDAGIKSREDMAGAAVEVVPEYPYVRIEVKNETASPQVS